MLVRDLLERTALRLPEKVAVVCDERRHTYAEIDAAASRFAASLLKAGIARGDRVVLRLENSLEAIVAIFGTLKAGAVFVPLGATVKAQKLAYVLDDSAAAALVADQRSEPVWGEAIAQSPHLRLVIVVGGQSGHVDGRERLAMADALRGDPAVLAGRPRCIDIDLAALVYTSGSTGQPKGVMLSHGNMLAAARSIGGYLENTADDVILNVLPLSFDYGLYQVFLTFQAGARLVLERAFVYPTVILEVMEREQVTALPLVPTLAAHLLNYDLSTLRAPLRYVSSTGAAFPPAFIAALRRQLPAVRIYSMYGLTECKRVSFLPPDEVEQRPASVGRPMDNVEVFVADEDGRLSPTGVGELVVRGSNVMQGYWNDPVETARVLRPGPYPGQRLLYSGDSFRIDDEGYMYFVGRRDDLIKSRGQRVSPKEVENVLYELPSVSGAAVVGVWDALLGMAIVAYITVRDGATLTPQEVLRHCAHRLEDFMVPQTVEIVPDLPRTESGKINRRALMPNGGASKSA